MDKVYLVERSYTEETYNGDYRREDIHDEDEVVYSTREGAQARCDELNQKEYRHAKAYWQRANRGRLEEYRTELKRYDTLAAAGVSYPEPRAPVNSEFPPIEEWLNYRYFDKDRYSVVEWELK